MKIFTNFEDWPNPVAKDSLAKRSPMETEKKTKQTKQNKNKPDELQDGERIRSRRSKVKSEAEFGPDQIREKVEINKNLKNVNKNMRSDRVLSSMPEDAKMIEERFSDVNPNDPNDPATVGKLQELLKKGAVGFSEKERQVLTKIIEK